MKNVSRFGIAKKLSALLLLASFTMTPALALASGNGGDDLAKLDDDDTDRVRIETQDDRVRIEVRADFASLIHSIMKAHSGLMMM